MGLRGPSRAIHRQRVSSSVEISQRLSPPGRIAAGQETGGAGGEGKLVVVPEQDDISFFHREPDPLVMGIQGPDPFLEHERAGGLDPCAAGLRQAAGLVVSFHRKSRQMFRNLFQ